MFSLKSEDKPVYFSCFFPEKIPTISNLYSLFDPLLFISTNSRPILSFNFKLFFLAKSSCTRTFPRSFFSIFLPSLIVKTPLVNNTFLFVLLVPSTDTTFLNSPGKSSLSIFCCPSTTLVLVGLAIPLYCGTTSPTSFIFSMFLNWSISK